MVTDPLLHAASSSLELWYVKCLGCANLRTFWIPAGTTYIYLSDASYALKLQFILGTGTVLSTIAIVYWISWRCPYHTIACLLFCILVRRWTIYWITISVMRSIPLAHGRSPWTCHHHYHLTSAATYLPGRCRWTWGTKHSSLSQGPSWISVQRASMQH